MIFFRGVVAVISLSSFKLYAHDPGSCTNFGAEDNVAEITFAKPFSNAAFKDAFLKLGKSALQKSGRSDIVIDRDGIVIHAGCLQSVFGGECDLKRRTIEFSAHDRDGFKYIGEATLFVIYDHASGQIQNYAFPRAVTCPGANPSACHETSHLTFTVYDAATKSLAVAPCAGPDAVLFSLDYN